MPELICKILHISKTTYYSYLKKGYSIVSFLNSFTKEELEELLESGRIKKFEIVQNNDYLLNKSIKLYKIINFKLTPKAKSIFFEELRNLKSYKIEDVSNIIFYSIKDEDLDSKHNYINGITEISIRLDIFNLFQRIDEFELEYFITNFEEIKLQSNNTHVRSKNKKELVLAVYGVEKRNIDEFKERFFKIEENHFIKIKTIEDDNHNQTLILFDIVTPIYNEKKSIKDFEVIEFDKKINLTINQYNVFSNLIVKITDMKFF